MLPIQKQITDTAHKCLDLLGKETNNNTPLAISICCLMLQVLAKRTNIPIEDIWKLMTEKEWGASNDR